MKLPLSVLFFHLGIMCGAGVLTAQDNSSPRPLSTVTEIRSLRHTEAANSLPVQLQGIVLFYDSFGAGNPYAQMLFISDGTAGIFVGLDFDAEPLHLRPGGRVAVSGRTHAANFAPIIFCDRLRLLGMGAVPAAQAVSTGDLLSSREDCNWVFCKGIIREDTIEHDRRKLVLAMDASRVPVYLAGPPDPRSRPGELIGARVMVRGVVAGEFSQYGQVLRVKLLSPDLSYVTELGPARSNPFDLSSTRITDLADQVQANGDEVVKVSGVVTYDWPGHTLFVTDGKRGLMVKSGQMERVAVGEAVDAVGFPQKGLHGAFLEDGVFQARQGFVGPIPAAKEVDDPSLLSGADDENNLVKIRGTLIDQKVIDQEQVLFLQTGKTFFCARLPSDAEKLDPNLPTGSTLMMKGILSREDLLTAAPNVSGWHSSGFQLLLRSPQDVMVIPFWTTSRILFLLLSAAAIIALFVLWIGLLQRSLAKQRAVIADQARSTATLEERNRIARELHDTLAQGFAGTAFVLEGIVPALKEADSSLRQPIEMALRMVRHSLSEARRSLMNLRADALEHRDLVTALNESAHDLITSSAIELRTDLQPLAVALTPMAENNFFRIGVEAMANAVHHGKPRKLEIGVRQSDGFVVMRILDDGTGFRIEDQATKRGHFGLVGMQERAREIGAELEIVSSPDSGTVITLKLNLTDKGPRSHRRTKA